MQYFSTKIITIDYVLHILPRLLTDRQRQRQNKNRRILKGIFFSLFFGFKNWNRLIRYSLVWITACCDVANFANKISEFGLKELMIFDQYIAFWSARLLHTKYLKKIKKKIKKKLHI